MFLSMVIPGHKSFRSSPWFFFFRCNLNKILVAPFTSSRNWAHSPKKTRTTKQKNPQPPHTHTQKAEINNLHHVNVFARERVENKMKQLYYSRVHWFLHQWCESVQSPSQTVVFLTVALQLTETLLFWSCCSCYRV